MVPAEEAATVKDFVAKLAARDFAWIELRLGANLRTPEARQKLEQAAGLMPAPNFRRKEVEARQEPAATIR